MNTDEINDLLKRFTFVSRNCQNNLAIEMILCVMIGPWL